MEKKKKYWVYPNTFSPGHVCDALEVYTNKLNRKIIVGWLSMAD